MLDAQDALIQKIAPLISPLGYEIVHLEVLNQKQKILRIYIETTETVPKTGIEDCTKVARALDLPLEQMPEIEQLFHGSYELEVSSPGLDRPLRQPKDFERFSGNPVRIHVFRPLTAEELENNPYQIKNPKQKNFSGVLRGVQNTNQNTKVILDTSPNTSKDHSKDEVKIPLSLITKANLEPKFEFNQESEKKS